MWESKQNGITVVVKNEKNTDIGERKTMFDKKYIRFTKAEILGKYWYPYVIYINMSLIEGFVETAHSIIDQKNYPSEKKISFTTLYVRNTEFSRDYHHLLVKESVDEIAKILGKALEEQNNWRS